MTEQSNVPPQAPAQPPEGAAPKPPWEEKPVTPVPRDARDHTVVREITGALPDAVLEAVEFAGQVTVTVAPARIVEVCRACKERLGYAFLVDLTAVDWPERTQGRFDVVYWMHRFSDSQRLRLKVVVADGVELPSVTGVWKVANWMEREVFDMFGIYFADHPNLERILTWEGFNGHPLRKDFPIEGVDTGAAVYPDVYPPGGGPVAGGEGES
ncbi:MAG TPA: NADH-quinone oxidoreductase subunit C [Thermoanaerobaculaceae bacterium]|nr:NADH-quinone oxidoreductase subunit C [Thermoanaerobaculaceae bacterium]